MSGMNCKLERLVRPSRPLAPKGGNDRIYTPDDTASLIVNHFRPCGRILEPCSGGKAFVRALNGECEECEIDEGTDFMEWTDPVDWIITNPPWSKFRDFLRHGMEVSDNVVFLCLINAWFMRARQRDMQEMGFGLVEILHVPVPPPPWPQAGFSLGAGWIRRGWTGGVHFSLPNNQNTGKESMKEACKKKDCEYWIDTPLPKSDKDNYKPNDKGNAPWKAAHRS